VSGGGTRLVGTAAVRQHQHSGPGAADLVAVSVGGGIGSVVRYLLATAFPPGHGFPWAIFAVNVSGCVWTFSTFGYETLRLLEDGALGEAGLNVVSSLVASVLVAWLLPAGGRAISLQG
jgi:CrcB protein